MSETAMRYGCCPPACPFCASVTTASSRSCANTISTSATDSCSGWAWCRYEEGSVDLTVQPNLLVGHGVREARDGAEACVGDVGADRVEEGVLPRKYHERIQPPLRRKRIHRQANLRHGWHKGNWRGHRESPATRRGYGARHRQNQHPRGGGSHHPGNLSHLTSCRTVRVVRDRSSRTFCRRRTRRRTPSGPLRRASTGEADRFRSARRPAPAPTGSHQTTEGS